MLQFSVQMTGVSCIQYYAPQIFAAIGFSEEKTFLFQVRAAYRTCGAADAYKSVHQLDHCIDRSNSLCYVL
jgi:hypothetical protein